MSYSRVGSVDSENENDNVTVSDDMTPSLLCMAPHDPSNLSHHTDSETIGLTSEAIGHNPLALLSTYASSEAKEEIRCIMKSLDDENSVKDDEEIGIQRRSRSCSREYLLAPSPIKGEKKKKQFSLSPWEIFSFAQGHVMNDMCAACWFTYLLVFLQKIVLLSPTNAGIVLISGQVADAIATSVVGVLSDKTKPLEVPLFWRGTDTYTIGPRKLWFMVGTLIVFVTFLCVFAIDPIPKDTEDQTAAVIYYSISASLFNIGWATVQISHLAMIPDLAKDDYTRVSMVSFRYIFTIISNSAVFLLYLYGENRYQTKVFSMIAYVTLGVGVISALILATGIHEPLDKFICPGNRSSKAYTLVSTETEPDTFDKLKNEKLIDETGIDVNYKNNNKNALVPIHDECSDQNAKSDNAVTVTLPKGIKKWYHWLYDVQLYMVAMVYMCSRIIVNFSQVYIYFYCAFTLNVTGSYSSLAPLTIYISSFVASLVLDRINRTIGRHGSFYAGACLVSISSVCMYLLKNDSSFMGNFHMNSPLFIYPIVVILGMGNATVMITSVSMEHDLVGDETQTGAFIYGILSFTDKLSCGILVFIAQVLRDRNCPEDPEACSKSHLCSETMRYIMVLPLLAAALTGSFFTFFVKKKNHD